MTSHPESDNRPKFVVVARPEELTNSAYNAFAVRYRSFLAALCSFASVSVIVIASFSVPDDSHDDLLQLGVDRVIWRNMPPVNNSRVARFQRMLTSIVGKSDSWEKELSATVVQTSATYAVSFAPWFDAELQGLFKTIPTMHFYEEDLRRMPENAPQTFRARMFRHLEDLVYSRTHSNPSIAISISTREIKAAKRRYPRSRHRCLPLTLPAADWPLADHPAEGKNIIVVGNFTEDRNAAGLYRFLNEYARRPLASRVPVHIISGSGLHQQLDPFMSLDWIQYLRDPESMSFEYRNSILALVPAQRVTGTKVTVLQAWANGCPVVCTAAVGATVSDPAAVLVGRTETELVDHVEYLISAHDRRRELALAGLRALKDNHDSQKIADLFKEICLDLSSR